MTPVETCLTCDRVFVPRPGHPGVMASHCDDCRRVLLPVWIELTLGRDGTPLRAEDV